MKKAIILLAALEAAALVGLFIFQQKETSRLKAELAGVRQELQEAQAALEARDAAVERVSLAEHKARVLQETLTQSSQISSNQSRQVAELEQSLASAKTNSGFAGIFNDPDMRKMIKEQQKVMWGTMIERNYGQLLKDLNLPPDQADQLKSLLEQKMSVAADLGMEMLGADPSKRKEMAAEIKKQTDAADQAIKDFLGEANYDAFKKYESTVSDRMNVAQFKEQYSGPETALNATQEQQLINLLNTSRKDFKWTTDYNDQSGAEDFSVIFSEDRLQRHAEEQSEYNRQVVERARQFMTANQISALERFLENQRKMQEAAMKMAGRMFQQK